MVPYTMTPPLGSPNPRDLWNWLERYEEQTGGDVLAIAHNGNLSNGIMFPIEAQYDGRRFDTDYVTNRIKWEPLYEITQIKGDGETHPFLSPDDEFADYGTWDKGNLDLSVAKSSNMLASEYGREALKRGLQIEAALGTFQDRPMTILWGMKDFCFTEQFLRGWIARFPDAAVHRFEDAGHYVVEDAHERILPILHDFLDRTNEP